MRTSLENTMSKQWENNERSPIEGVYTRVCGCVGVHILTALLQTSILSLLQSNGHAVHRNTRINGSTESHYTETNACHGHYSSLNPFASGIKKVLLYPITGLFSVKIRKKFLAITNFSVNDTMSGQPNKRLIH